jgi:hypothetical protein
MNEFMLRPERDVEEPLYLGSAEPRISDRGRPTPVRSLIEAADRPLHLDVMAREPRRRGGGVALVVACLLTFLLAAGIGALVLDPPPALRDRIASALGREKTAVQAARVATPQPAPQLDAAPAPLPEAAQAPAPQAEAGPTPNAVPPSTSLEAPPAKPATKARAHVRKPKPAHAAAPKKPSASAKSARAHHASEPSLDLDALEKSLR